MQDERCKLVAGDWVRTTAVDYWAKRPPGTVALVLRARKERWGWLVTVAWWPPDAEWYDEFDMPETELEPWPVAEPERYDEERAARSKAALTHTLKGMDPALRPTVERWLAHTAQLGADVRTALDPYDRIVVCAGDLAFVYLTAESAYFPWGAHLPDERGLLEGRDEHGRALPLRAEQDIAALFAAGYADARRRNDG